MFFFFFFFLGGNKIVDYHTKKEEEEEVKQNLSHGLHTQEETHVGKTCFFYQLFLNSTKK